MRRKRTRTEHNQKNIVSEVPEAAEIDQAIEYFKDELSQMEVFSDIVSFREVERKSIETALKALQRIQEESQAGQQAVMCDIAQKEDDTYGRNKGMSGMW